MAKKPKPPDPPKDADNVVPIDAKRPRPRRQGALTGPLTQTGRVRRRPLKAKDIQEVEKMARVLEERKAGRTFDEIAKRNGFYDQSSASKFCKRALELTIQETADEVRKIEVERYDRWLLALEPKVQEGDPRAVEQAIKISDRRAALMGLDAPAQTEVTVNSNARQLNMTLDATRPEVLQAVHSVLRLRPAELPPAPPAEPVIDATSVEEPEPVKAKTSTGKKPRGAVKKSDESQNDDRE